MKYYPRIQDANLTLQAELDYAKLKLESATLEVAKIQSLIEFKKLEAIKDEAEAKHG